VAGIGPGSARRHTPCRPLRPSAARVTAMAGPVLAGPMVGGEAPRCHAVSDGVTLLLSRSPGRLALLLVLRVEFPTQVREAAQPHAGFACRATRRRRRPVPCDGPGWRSILVPSRISARLRYGRMTARPGHPRSASAVRSQPWRQASSRVAGTLTTTLTRGQARPERAIGPRNLIRPQGPRIRERFPVRSRLRQDAVLPPLSGAAVVEFCSVVVDPCTQYA
jgi:hypothetical protein